MGWGVKGRGTPAKVAGEIGGTIARDHDETPDGWEASLHHSISGAVQNSIAHMGQLLVARDLHNRREARVAIMVKWRAGVEAKRAEYEKLPAAKQKGFVADAEPDLGPEPTSHEISAECSGSVDADGVSSFSVHVALATD